MLSHDLARVLLSRRNNDVRFAITIDERGKDPYETHVRMGDDSEDPKMVISPHDVVNYYPPGDYITIELDVLELGYGDDE